MVTCKLNMHWKKSNMQAQCCEAQAREGSLLTPLTCRLFPALGFARVTKDVTCHDIRVQAHDHILSFLVVLP